MNGDNWSSIEQVEKNARQTGYRKGAEELRDALIRDLHPNQIEQGYKKWIEITTTKLLTEQEEKCKQLD